MKFARHVRILLAAGICCWSALVSAGEGSPLQVALSGATAGIESLTVDGKQTNLPAPSGGFSAYDATAKKHLEFASGSLQRDGAKSVFRCQSGDLRLTAEFADQGSYLLVSGSLENLQAAERGIVLDYRIPCAGPQAVFCNELNRAVKVGDAETEGNLYPIAAMCCGDLGIALAIPPSRPCEFGMAGSSRGLVARFYLGLSPKTANLPNRAPFAFVVYPVDAQWGFRSALAIYYRLYPDYYTPRIKKFGEMLIYARVGDEPPDIEHYMATRINFNQAEREFARNKKFGLLSWAYLNPGVVSLGHLPQKPRSLEEATAIYRKLCESTAEEWTAGGPEPGPVELVQSSACHLSTGRPAMSVRYTPGEKNALVFKANPNPDLFGDKIVSIGKKTLWTAEGWLKKYPQLDGLIIDSLGANWPAVLNYRKDHFAGARCGLTCDAQGRVALHNELSYYELLDALRTRLRAMDKFLVGNGIYSYPSNNTLEPEHYRGRGVTLGRFFLAALLDWATSESGVQADQSRIEFCRVALGRKSYVLTNSHWDDVETMKNWFNKTLVYGVCGQNVRIYSTTEAVTPYYPQGYQRDKELIGWYLSQQEMLWKAGWEPVTYAKANQEKVYVERFGSGSLIYFAVMSENDQPLPCTLEIELKPLGLQPGKLSVEEVARKLPVNLQGSPENTTCRVRLNLRPNESQILKLSSLR